MLTTDSLTVQKDKTHAAKINVVDGFKPYADITIVSQDIQLVKAIEKAVSPLLQSTINNDTLPRKAF